MIHTLFQQQKHKNSAHACNYQSSSGNLFFLEHPSSGRSGITEVKRSQGQGLMPIKLHQEQMRSYQLYILLWHFWEPRCFALETGKISETSELRCERRSSTKDEGTARECQGTLILISLIRAWAHCQSTLWEWYQHWLGAACLDLKGKSIFMG